MRTSLDVRLSIFVSTKKHTSANMYTPQTGIFGLNLDMGILKENSPFNINNNNNATKY